MANLNTLTVSFSYVTLWCLVVGIPSAKTTTFTDTIVSVNITRGNGRSSNFTDTIKVVALDTSTCDDNLQLKTALGADCTSSRKQGGLCHLDCSCLDGTASFVLSEKRCADDRKFREGCYFVFGSWTWTSGWTWNTENDPLQVLYVEGGYGITSGFNASTSEFSQCTFTSMAIYDEHGAWKAFTAPANESIMTFFKFRGIWHLSWIIEVLSTTKADEMEGKFVKMNLTCGSENSVNGSVETSLQTSCIVFKVTGNLTYQYKATAVKTTSSSTDQISSVILQTSYPMTQSSSSVSQTASLIDQTAHTNVPVAQTSGITDKTLTQKASITTAQPSSSISISNTNSTNKKTDQYKATAVKTTSSSTDQISSLILQTSYPMTQSSSAVSQTASLIGQTAHTSVPVAQTSGITDKTLTPKASITTVQPSSSISISNTNSTNKKTDGAQIGLIIGTVIGGSAVILVLIATVVTSIAHHHQPRRSTKCTDIPMRHKKGRVLPEYV